MCGYFVCLLFVWIVVFVLGLFVLRIGGFVCCVLSGVLLRVLCWWLGWLVLFLAVLFYVITRLLVAGLFIWCVGVGFLWVGWLVVFALFLFGWFVRFEWVLFCVVLVCCCFLIVCFC